MRRIYCFINLATLAQTPATASALKAFSASLISGDAQNDRQPRQLVQTVIGEDYDRLLQALHDTPALDSSCDVYVIGFGHLTAELLTAAKAKHDFRLFVVNAPGQRHPAALVAIADATKRVRPHHLATAHNPTADVGSTSLHAEMWQLVILD